jgi:hypothetical protein
MSWTATLPPTQKMSRMVSCGGTSDVPPTLICHAWLGIIFQSQVSSVCSTLLIVNHALSQQLQLMLNAPSVKAAFFSHMFAAVSPFSQRTPCCVLASGVYLASSETAM